MMIVLLIAFVISVAFKALQLDIWIFDDCDWAEFILIWCAVVVVTGTIALFISVSNGTYVF